MIADGNSGGEQVRELRERAGALQEELNGVYKEKSRLAEEVLESTRRLQIVRENFEQHDKTLTERTNTIKQLKAQKKELAAEVGHLKEAQAEAVKELEVCSSFSQSCAAPLLEDE